MEKINKLKSKFKEYNLDGYLIPKNDEFFNEYVPDHKDDLQYISNFSGSYGLALVLKKDNFLFVDGRYTVQANLQSGKAFKILKIPIIKNKISSRLKNKKIGFDPKLFNEFFIKQFSKKLSIKCISINDNLIKSIKKKQNSLKQKNKFYVLDKSITGKSCQEKLKKLKLYIKKK